MQRVALVCTHGFADVLTLGRQNRVEEIIWGQNTTKNQSPTYSTNHEYVEVFARDLTVASEWILTRRIAEWKKAAAPDLAKRPTVFLLLAG